MCALLHVARPGAQVTAPSQNNTTAWAVLNQHQQLKHEWHGSVCNALQDHQAMHTAKKGVRKCNTVHTGGVGRNEDDSSDDEDDDE